MHNLTLFLFYTPSLMDTKKSTKYDEAPGKIITTCSTFVSKNAVQIIAG